jgi:hypothetical protein
MDLRSSKRTLDDLKGMVLAVVIAPFVSLASDEALSEMVKSLAK